MGGAGGGGGANGGLEFARLASNLGIRPITNALRTQQPNSYLYKKRSPALLDPGLRSIQSCGSSPRTAIPLRTELTRCMAICPFPVNRDNLANSILPQG